jgi:hypothetical protein
MKSREESLAVKMTDMVSDIRVNPELVGFYLAHTPEPEIYDRLEEMLESAKHNRSEREYRIKKMILGLDLPD